MNKLLKIKKSMAIVLTLVIMLSLVAPAMAQEDSVAPGINVPATSSKALGPTDPAELEAFLDDLFAKDMEANHIAGAAVAVVKDGELFFAKGYGYADLENGIPVDPERTGFRIGSVTKLFTWTAVMQLVEQGKLDLDADVNTYLDFHIPDTYPQPITLKHLLTHTAGFEDRWLEFLALQREDVAPWGEWMASHIPARVSPPGEQAAYSNYGTSLAGYIVAQISGQPYERYIEEHIFNPLGMAHSTAQLPRTPELLAQASVGYTYADGAFQVFPELIPQWVELPAGLVQASATDMARFMIAHLQGGRYSDADIPEARLLEEATVQQMHTTLYAPDPRILGNAYGFFDFSDNGQRALGHNGESTPMFTELLLLPDQNLGVFVTYNSMGGAQLTGQHLGFQRAFFDHYYPAPPLESIQPPADFAERAGRFEGSYRLTQMSYTTLEKYMGLFGAGVLEVDNSGDGALLLTTPWGEWRFVEVEPLYFRMVDANVSIAFREDDRGRITHLFTDLTPMYSFERLNWYEMPGLHMALLQASLLIFLSVPAVASIRAIRGRRPGGERKPAPRGARLAEWIILGISVLNLLFVAGMFLWGNAKPMFGVSTAFQIVLGLGVLSAALTAGALVYIVLAWKNRYWGLASRLYYTLGTVAAVAYVWFLNYWNLLGWRY